MNTHFRKIAILFALSGFALSLGACHTMQGLGEDTEIAGEKIQKEADSHIDKKDKDKSDDRPQNRS